MNKLKFTFILCFITIVNFAQTAKKGIQSPPTQDIGVGIKKNQNINMTTVTTNEKGQVSLNGLEKEEYNSQELQTATTQTFTENDGHVTLLKKNGEKT